MSDDIMWVDKWPAWTGKNTPLAFGRGNGGRNFSGLHAHVFMIEAIARLQKMFSNSQWQGVFICIYSSQLINIDFARDRYTIIKLIP